MNTELLQASQAIKFQFFRFEEQTLKALKEFLLAYKKLSLKGSIICIYIANNTSKERASLRLIINNYPGNFILFSPSATVAELAWEAGAAYYINVSKPDWLQKTTSALASLSQHEYAYKIAIKTHYQTDVVNTYDIVFILAQGNYCEIHLADGKTLLVTKQLGQMEQLLLSFHFLKRFGKSTILNLNKITSIKDKTIIFANNEKLNFPKYSKGFIYLKNLLIWNN
ncbi:MAG: LytTR family DNA-binding domain-containing protein [Bacteroidales bacterium]|nr:LytTR family DNA-binding domain-containing protein [Bacteroidales bacterium]